MTLRRVHLARCGSTNAVAAAWARAGGPLPVVVSADTQSGGRGRWGRRWQSPPGGCWFTLALSGDAAEPADGGLALAAAAGVRDGILDACGPLGVAVVEPNDLLLGDAKVAGLLCERLAGPATLVGVGINANAAPEAADPRTGEPLRRPAASLAAALGRPVDLAALRDACVKRLVAGLERPGGDGAQGSDRM